MNDKWFARPQHDGGFYVGVAEVGWNIADTAICRDIQTEEHARLLAAAPELLELLEDLMEPGTGAGEYEKARALITKVRGERRAFNWEKPLYKSAKSAAICDVPGVGRLQVRRYAPGTRTFIALINGKRASADYYTSLDAAKAHLEELAGILSVWKPDGAPDDSSKNQENKT